MDDKKIVQEVDTSITDDTPMEEKNTTTTSEEANYLVSAVSQSVEVVAAELSKFQPLVQENSKSNQFQNF